MKSINNLLEKFKNIKSLNKDAAKKVCLSFYEEE